MLAGVSDNGGTLSIEISGAEKVSVVAEADNVRVSADIGTFADNGVAGGLVSGFGTNEILVSAGSGYSTIQLTDTAAGSSVSFLYSAANSYPFAFDIELNDAAAGWAVLFECTSNFGNHDVHIVGDTRVHLRTADGNLSDGAFTVTAVNEGDSSTNLEGVELWNSTLTTTGAGDVLLDGKGRDLGTDLEGRVGVRLTNSEIHLTSADPVLARSRSLEQAELSGRLIRGFLFPTLWVSTASWVMRRSPAPGRTLQRSTSLVREVPRQDIMWAYQLMHRMSPALMAT